MLHYKKLARKLHLKGDRIITEEDRHREENDQQKAAMDEYIKHPTPANKAKLRALNVSNAMLNAYERGEEYQRDIGLIERFIGSPSHIVKKIAAFRLFYNLGDNAQRKLVRLRNYYNNEPELFMHVDVWTPHSAKILD